MHRLRLWEYLEFYVNSVRPLMDIAEKKTSGALPKPAHLDLSAFSSWQELTSLGLDRLKSALMALGIKCGGSLDQRAQRLFSTKGKNMEDWDPLLFTWSGKPNRNKSRSQTTGEGGGAGSWDRKRAWQGPRGGRGGPAFPRQDQHMEKRRKLLMEKELRLRMMHGGAPTGEVLMDTYEQGDMLMEPEMFDDDIEFDTPGGFGRRPFPGGFRGRQFHDGFGRGGFRGGGGQAWGGRGSVHGFDRSGGEGLLGGYPGDGFLEEFGQFPGGNRGNHGGFRGRGGGGGFVGRGRMDVGNMGLGFGRIGNFFMEQQSYMNDQRYAGVESSLDEFDPEEEHFGRDKLSSRKRWALLTGGGPSPFSAEGGVIVRPNTGKLVEEKKDFDESITRLKVTIPLQSLMDQTKLYREKMVSVEDFRSLVGNHKQIKGICYFIRSTDPRDATVRNIECQLYLNNVFMSSAQTRIARCSVLDLNETVWKKSPERQNVLNDAYIKVWQMFLAKTAHDICTSHRILRDGEVPEGTFSHLAHGSGKYSTTNISTLIRMKHPFKPWLKSSLAELIFVHYEDVQSLNSFQILDKSCSQSGLLLEVENELKQLHTTNTTT